MACNHERVRCTDNVFYCLDCGAVVSREVKAEKNTTEVAKPAEGRKTAYKRKGRKETAE